MSLEHNIGSAQDLSVDPRARRILDRALAAGEAVPTGAQSQLDWLNEATNADPAGRYLTEIWRERTDLRETFPGMHLDADAAQRFRLWAYHFAAAECACPAALVPAIPVGITDLIAPSPTGPPPTLTPGVQLYGYLRATLGLGEAARRLVSLLDLADEPTLARPYDHIGSPLAYPWPDPLAVDPPDLLAAAPSFTTDPSPSARADSDSDALTSEHPLDQAKTSTPFEYDIALLCVNGAEIARLTRAIGGAALHGRYRVGLWFWELEQLTPEMAAGLEHLDEVWVTSEFVANAVRYAAPPNFPVHILPLGMDLPATVSLESNLLNSNVSIIENLGATPGVPPVTTGSDRSAVRTRLGFPRDAAHGLVIGFAFDYASRIARKNPLGLIEAFIQAFPRPFSLAAPVLDAGAPNPSCRLEKSTDRSGDEVGPAASKTSGPAEAGSEVDVRVSAGPWLVIKAINPGATPDDADRVRSAIAGRSDIILIEQHLSPEDQRAYISSLDVVASLHRSEGYGLLMLEAMAQGIPTVATEYSGNLAFMSHQNSWLVPATRITVDETAEPYPAGYTWADPSIASAASTLRWIISGLTTSSSRAAADVTKRTNQALLDTKPLIDGTAGAAFVRQRLTEIRALRSAEG